VPRGGCCLFWKTEGPANHNHFSNISKMSETHKRKDIDIDKSDSKKKKLQDVSEEEKLDTTTDSVKEKPLEIEDIVICECDYSEEEGLMVRFITVYLLLGAM
jgi:hypothetical protein